MKKDNENIITLKDENGVDTNFEVIATLEVNDSEYTILLPLDGESEDAVIFKIIEENGEPILEYVVNDEEFDTVAAAYQEMSDDEFDEETDEESDEESDEE